MKVHVINHHCDPRMIKIPGTDQIVDLQPYTPVEIFLATEQQLDELRKRLSARAPAYEIVLTAKAIACCPDQPEKEITFLPGDDPGAELETAFVKEESSAPAPDPPETTTMQPPAAPPPAGHKHHLPSAPPKHRTHTAPPPPPARPKQRTLKRSKKQ